MNDEQTGGGGGQLDQLRGLKVVEMGQNLAGPYASLILADLGAEVVKVEKPGGDDARGWGPPFVEGSAVSFQLMNRNKKSVVLDLADPEDYETFLGLISWADVFVHNMRPGVETKLKADSETLRATNPRLIYCQMSAFGNTARFRNVPDTNRCCRHSVVCWRSTAIHPALPRGSGRPSSTWAPACGPSSASSPH